jgi:hypothetical protein
MIHGRGTHEGRRVIKIGQDAFLAPVSVVHYFRSLKQVPPAYRSLKFSRISWSLA